jgi:hypothetical protein
MTSPAPAPLKLEIGTLRLAGYSARDGARLGGALRHELGRVLEAQALPQAGWRQELLALPRFAMRPGERPEQTGRRLARAIARALRP